MSITVMKLALEALETAAMFTPSESQNGKTIRKAITSLRQAIADAQEQEPYCWTWDEWVRGGRWRAEFGWKKPERDDIANLQPLYTKE